jgi:23S rRNA (uracil1939-C5)-methyltransferase
VACAAFLECGGCTLQQFDAAEQLALKQQWMLRLLDEQGVEPKTVAAPVSGDQLGYRRKARLGARYLAEKSEFLLGFRESFGNRIARLERCPVLAAPFGAGLESLKRLLGGLEIRADVPQIEIAVGQSGATLAVRHLRPITARDLGQLADYASRTGVQVLLQGGGYETLQRLDGGAERPLSYRLDNHGVCLQFGIADFVQVNASVNERLVSAAVGLLAPGPDQRVLDLFCGLGNFTLPLSLRRRWSIHRDRVVGRRSGF